MLRGDSFGTILAEKSPIWWGLQASRKSHGEAQLSRPSPHLQGARRNRMRVPVHSLAPNLFAQPLHHIVASAKLIVVACSRRASLSESCPAKTSPQGSWYFEKHSNGPRRIRVPRSCIWHNTSLIGESRSGFVCRKTRFSTLLVTNIEVVNVTGKTRTSRFLASLLRWLTNICPSRCNQSGCMRSPGVGCVRAIRRLWWSSSWLPNRGQALIGGKAILDRAHLNLPLS